MTNRNLILTAVAKNQPEYQEIPDIPAENNIETETLQSFKQVLSDIGGTALEAKDIAELKVLIQTFFPESSRKVSTMQILSDIVDTDLSSDFPHDFEDVDVAILEGHFGVAENGAVWITEDKMGQRILPFICQHLVLIIHKDEVCATMQQAYAKVGTADYGFGTFIAGPSKTADIEQSLVLGAHGPKSLLVLILS
ncbi:LutC/YkgG family protein [Pedobacter duraquae]|uniref:L-lactate dehydrogenase complex protein LldG n=1 Tax=Pedobacter duraquae TaxID=425511 RepID=A0A4R6IBJ9_9SPHI|nr:LUD domain-containing protein [Pedobacter duraquae]TDO19580.1 L-lactate dehydrogenase complex protein LldG [Pedobacter duraquae]